MLTREDQAIRCGRITSSTAAACLGLDPYCTPMRAWMRITGREEPTFAANDDGADDDGDDDGAEASADAASRGHWIEPSLIAYGAHWLVQDTRGTVTFERPSTVAHPDIPWLADSMDALYRIAPRDGGQVVLVGCEAKTVAQPHAYRWGEAPDGIVPDYVQIQCAIHAMHYPEARCVLVPTLIGGMHTLSCYVVERERDLEFALIESLGNWHRIHVVGDEPPPAVPRDNKMLSRVWRGGGDAIADDPIIADLALRDVQLRAELKEKKDARDGVQVELKQRLRDHTECRGEWGSVTWRRSKPSVKVDHDAAFGKLRRRVAASLDAIDVHHLPQIGDPDNTRGMTVDEIADNILRECTSERPGSRVLRTNAKREKGGA